MVENFILFGTDCCHLCEQAQALISHSEAMLTSQIAVEEIDIAEHSQWFDKYSVRIPVLLHPESQAELVWPFDEQVLTKFIDEIAEQNLLK